ncbi:MAG: LuxR C-terminal-related transcriptional regulator [Chloroflexota bacterium]
MNTTRVYVAEVLTPRETEICHHLANGLDNDEIADELCIAIGTVKKHTMRIRQKLKVSKTLKAAVMLRSHGFGGVIPITPIVTPEATDSFHYFDRKSTLPD